jgi:uncharacterized protein (DUF1697 family)
MPSHAAFLRGINLGRNRRVSSAELRTLFAAMGFENADTFRTSGNVVFDAGRETAARVGKRIERGLAEALGYEVAVFLRSAGELRAIAEHQPFPPELVEGAQGKLQVALLAAKPGKSIRTEVLAAETDADRLAFGDRELYWLPSGGIRDSALGMKGIERLVGSTTVRTKGTLELLAAKYFAD